MGVRWKLGVALVSLLGLTGCSANLPQISAPKPPPNPGWKQTAGAYVPSNNSVASSDMTASNTAGNTSNTTVDNSVANGSSSNDVNMVSNTTPGTSSNTVSNSSSGTKPSTPPVQYTTMPSDNELETEASKDIQMIILAETKPTMEQAVNVLKQAAVDQFFMNDEGVLQNYLVGKGYRLEQQSVSIVSDSVQSKTPSNAAVIVDYTVRGEIADSKGKIISAMAEHEYKTYLWMVREPSGWLVYNTASLG